MSLITTEMLKTNYDPKISMPMSQYAKSIVDTRNETVDEVLDIIDWVRRDANNGYMFDMVKEIRVRVEMLKGDLL